MEVPIIVEVDINGVFKSPSVFLQLKLFSGRFPSVFCCCNTACLNVSSNGLAIIMVVTIADEPQKFEVVGCPVDVDVVTNVGAVEIGTAVVAMSVG